MNLVYRLATLRGRLNRELYAQFYPSFARRPLPSRPSIPVTVFSFSGENDWLEQALSLRSFLAWVGIPERYVIVSDGTHARESRERLCQISPCVSVVSLESVVRADLPERLARYAARHPLGKKVSALISYPVEGPTIYSDSDILYFPGARDLARLAGNLGDRPRFLLDCFPSLDERLLAGEAEKALPVNSGFLLLRRSLDWKPALERLERMAGEPGYFTEQTLVHLAAHSSLGEPLDPERYILKADDQCQWADRYARGPIVLRHYISSIRYKFWYHLFAVPGTGKSEIRNSKSETI